MVPGFRRGAEGDHVICAGTSECAGGIVVCVAVSAWAGALEQLRVRRGSALIGSRIGAAAAVLRFPERLARALARNVLFSVGARDLELRGASAVQIHLAPGFGTVPPGAALWDHHQRKVIPINQAHVVEVEASVAVELKLRKCGRGSSATTCAF